MKMRRREETGKNRKEEIWIMENSKSRDFGLLGILRNFF
jgi:hypothetical protein